MLKKTLDISALKDKQLVMLVKYQTKPKVCAVDDWNMEQVKAVIHWAEYSAVAHAQYNYFLPNGGTLRPNRK